MPQKQSSEKMRTRLVGSNDLAIVGGAQARCPRSAHFKVSPLFDLAAKLSGIGVEFGFALVAAEGYDLALVVRRDVRTNRTRTDRARGVDGCRLSGGDHGENEGEQSWLFEHRI